jgi:hypothetical protein
MKHSPPNVARPKQRLLAAVKHRHRPHATDRDHDEHPARALDDVRAADVTQL